MDKVLTATIVILLVGISFAVPAFSAGSKITQSTPIILDQHGNKITDSISAGTQIQIASNVTNNQKIDQPFVYIVQIKNGAQVTVSLSWITGTITAGQTFSPSQAWTAAYPSSYTARTFLWQGISNPVLLVNPSTIQFKVVGGLHHYYPSDSVALSGSVNPPFHNNSVMLLVEDPSNNLIQIANAPVSASGTFSTNIITGGPLFTQTGTYHVLVYYLGVKQNGLSFNCTSVSPIACS